MAVVADLPAVAIILGRTKEMPASEADSHGGAPNGEGSVVTRR